LTVVHLKYWPRRVDGLPPGQRLLSVFPRFGEQPRRPPPEAGPVALAVSVGGEHRVTIDADALGALESVERVHDFHCVTTWSRTGLRWSGVRMRDVWTTMIEPVLGDQGDASYVVARGGDGYRAVFRREDLLAEDALVVIALDDAPLDARHGAPLRLVSPSQYGYKSVKHLVGFDIRRAQPKLGGKEHLRARVALEERHTRIPGRLLRVPYRMLIPPTAAMAERSLRAGSTPR
jgi:DMSO/TMAO reductase YedYZ molybdopterin-dependent catalytic subunit